MAGLTIGKFADAEGVGVETVRFYQRRGLLAQPARGRSGFREYSEDDRWRLAFIRRARALGFSLAEIRDLLGPAQARSTGEIVRAAELKLAAIAARSASWPSCSAGCAAWSRSASTAAVTTASPCTSGWPAGRRAAGGSWPSAADRGTLTEGTTVMGTVKAVTDDSFEDAVLRNPRPVIVEYWAVWCRPCRQLGPVLDAIAADHADAIDVVKMNTDENPQTTVRYGVMLVPTVSVFHGGQVVKELVGARSKAALLREVADFL